MLSTSLEKKSYLLTFRLLVLVIPSMLVKLSTKHGVKKGVSLIFEEVGKLEKVFGIWHFNVLSTIACISNGQAKSPVPGWQFCAMVKCLTVEPKYIFGPDVTWG